MPQTLEREPIQDLTEVLFRGAGPPVAPARQSRIPRKWMYVAGVFAVIILAAGIVLARRVPAPADATVRVNRTTLAKTISATGRLQALTTVQVGTQVSGTISEIYADFNGEVKKGQVIARLDPGQLQAQLTQATANLTGAQAS